jgi:hypothetical protein
VTTIFYDLETSDVHPIGQIINYAFIAVDDALRPLSECCGEVKLTRLQLPSPGAILANRVNVLELQQGRALTERDALLRIWDFIADIARESETPVKLIGYNSGKFDLPFLRTSFIRNGLNPYFEGRVVPGDLLLLVRKLSVSNPRFPRVTSPKDPNGKLSLSLETLTKHFDLLDGPQAHESRADVLLTIALAAVLREQFDADVLTYHPYEVPPTLTRGSIVPVATAQYDLEVADIAHIHPYLSLDGDHRSALWVDLDKFAKSRDRSAVSWMNKSTGACYIGPATWKPTAEHETLAREAVKTFNGLTVKNFFERSQCDIEMDIYRIDFQGIEALREAIWERQPTKVKESKSVDVKTLFDRHRMTYYPWGAGHDEAVREMIRQYALYRYGGKLFMRKGGSPHDPQVTADDFHEHYSVRVARMNELLSSSSTNEHDRELIAALTEFYKASDITKIVGDEWPAR